ncbi:MAG: putative quinol monooxygenase [Nocardioides sp.]
MSELHAVATIPAKAGSEDAVRTALTTLAEATRQQEGCLSYDLYESASTPGTFVTVERWTDQAALEAHLGTPHVATAFAAADGHLSGEVAVHPLVPVS